MKTKKRILSHYQQFFISQVIFRTICWLIFLPIFVFAGERYLQVDFLGKIFRTFFGKERSFKEYFIGSTNKSKNKILNYIFWFILAIIILNLISIFVNLYLWKRDRYIKNNNFFLHKLPVFIINSLIKIACVFLLSFSFVSPFTLLISLIFITFNTWILRFHKKNDPSLKIFFSWKNRYARKIILYSSIIILVTPFIIGTLNGFIEKTQTESPQGLAKAFKEIFNASSITKVFLEALSSANVGVFHWLILIWFGRKIINEKINEFNSFWLKVNTIEKKVTNFRHYYYYQESWALANKSLINLGDYSYLENAPNFLSKIYLEKNLKVDEFASQNLQVVKYIEFCENKVKKPDKKNFLNYCLFNEFDSWKDCEVTRQLIDSGGK